MALTGWNADNTRKITPDGLSITETHTDMVLPIYIDSVCNNAKPWKNQYDFNEDQSTDITGWGTGTSLPEGVSYSESVVTKNRVYLLGGYDGTNSLSTVYTAPVNGDGTLGTWTTGTSLPGVLRLSQAIVTKDRVYLLGGYTTTSVSTVYTAPINTDGTLGTWTTGTSLPGVLRESRAIVTKDRVYLMGGFNASSTTDTVYTAPINSDGTLGTWTTDSPLPGGIRLSQAIVTKDRVYLLGGYTTGAVATVYTAPINSDGTLGTWTTGTSLPGPLRGSQAVVTKNRAYLMGGLNSSSTVSTVYQAPINPDGTLGTWTTGTSLPGVLSDSAAIITNSKVMLTGGVNATSTVATVYEANFSGGLNDYTRKTYDSIDIPGVLAEPEYSINAKPWKNQYEFNIDQSTDITGWSAGTSLPGTLRLAQGIATNSRVYLLGGYDGTSTVSTVYTSPINSDGTLGTWTTGTSLPGVLRNSQVVVTKDRVYLLGGSGVSTVYTAPINTDGTLGTWTTGTSLPGVLSDSQAITTKDRVYLLGGYNGSTEVSTVYTAPINPDGTLGTWTTGTSLPGVLSSSQAVTTKDRVYLLGGYTGSYVSTVYTAPINPDGTLGTWTTGTSLPGTLGSHQAVVTKDRIFLIGGLETSNPVSTVFTAPVNPDGTLGTWTTGTSLPGTLGQSQVMTSNSKVFLLGGLSGSSTVATVYEANFSGGLNDYTDYSVSKQYRRIAVELGDTGTQTEVEVAYWDETTKEALLWVYDPSFTSSSFYTFYWDMDHIDNPEYVGLVGSTTGQSVWPSDYALVQHMQHYDTTIDSTSNGNDGTSTGLVAGNEVDSFYGKALEFDGVSTQKITTTQQAAINNLSQKTIMFCVDLDAHSGSGTESHFVNKSGWYLATDPSNTRYVFVHNNATTVGSWSVPQPDLEPHVISMSYDNGLTTNDPTVYIDGVSQTVTEYSTPDGAAPDDSASNLIVANQSADNKDVDGVMARLQLLSSLKSANWHGIQAYALNKSLFSFSSEGPIPTTVVLNFLSQDYALLSNLRNYLEATYSLRLFASLIQRYNAAEFVVQYLTQNYSDGYKIRSFLKQLYRESNKIRNQLEQGYSLAEVITSVLEQEYNITKPVDPAIMNQLYSIKTTDEVLAILKQAYTMYPDPGLISDTFSVTIDGNSVQALGVSVEFSRSSYVGKADLNLALYGEWLTVAEYQTVTIVINSDTYEFLVSSKNRSQSVRSETLSVECMSQAFLLDYPHATQIEDNNPISGTMSQTVEALANLEGLSIVWDLPVDDQLNSTMVQSEGEAPIKVIREIVNAVGGILQSRPDGSIHAEARYPVDSDKYNTVTPDNFFDTSNDYIELSEEIDRRDGYNKYLVTDFAVDKGYTLEAEQVTSTHYKLKAFRVPWTTKPVVLNTSELTNISILPAGNPVFETVTEEGVEIVAGSGKVGNPCYSVISYDYDSSTNLGAITVKEDGTVTTNVTGESLVNITYTTKYWQWDVFDTDSEQVQLILETL